MKNSSQWKIDFFSSQFSFHALEEISLSFFMLSVVGVWGAPFEITAANLFWSSSHDGRGHEFKDINISGNEAAGSLCCADRYPDKWKLWLVYLLDHTTPPCLRSGWYERPSSVLQGRSDLPCVLRKSWGIRSSWCQSDNVHLSIWIAASYLDYSLWKND